MEYQDYGDCKVTRKHGEFHSYDDKPAVVFHNGELHWYEYGKRHRDDGPAITHPSGYQVWYCNGKYHRDDGSAVIHYDGGQEWYRHGVIHRDDGPATIHNGFAQWWINGVKIKEGGCISKVKSARNF